MKDNYTEQLYKIMRPEYYKNVPLINVLGRWMYGTKSFDSKEDLKKFIDKCKK